MEDSCFRDLNAFSACLKLAMASKISPLILKEPALAQRENAMPSLSPADS
jgi:hypothetical protein